MVEHETVPQFIQVIEQLRTDNPRIKYVVVSANKMLKVHFANTDVSVVGIAELPHFLKDY